ncbi:hypothetical protein [Sphingobacterium kitahiroshimense]|uniref:Uncharacterized protein n=1 Tax=Sphingobacterium kitahiroshimense TaxID=470446 RepID=A0ABV0BM76_9SPHI
MNEIKSLADQLREKLRSGEPEMAQPKEQKRIVKPPPVEKRKKPPKAAADEARVQAFFQALESFQLEATEKSLIRVDSRTMNLLKRIKLAKGIDMNRFIVYSLHQYLAQHPWLAAHIQETLKKTEL